MDVNVLLKDVINLNEYITATQDVVNKSLIIKVGMNITTVLTLKKIRSLEIEYFKKCEENGVACIVLERLLGSPLGKAWGVLARELISLLRYWLEGMRKYLINHNTSWWTFMKLIMKFIMKFYQKGPAIANLLVELTAECLFDLATAPRPDVFQRYEILHCLNTFCAESGREIRFAMRNTFSDYLVKIAANMATLGYFPCQYSSLECLVRWLVPRQDPTLRAAAAEKWLPPDLCPPAARSFFLTCDWMNFIQDSREFLNALNKGNGLVTSVICRQLSIGSIVIINGSERQLSWLDFNTYGKSISLLLSNSSVLEVFGVPDHVTCETLQIDNEITETALLHRESLGLTISLKTLRGPYIQPADINTGDASQVTIVVSSQADLLTLDGAMKNTFGDKYQCQLDLESYVSLSPQRSIDSRNQHGSEEDTRFSHPVEVKRRKNSDKVGIKSCKSISQSTASTSSLIQLKDRLAALPRYNYDINRKIKSAKPALSNVTELSERDDRSTSTYSTLKFIHGYKSYRETSSDIKSRSDGEFVRQRSRGGRRKIFPVISDDNASSLALVKKLGSNNDSVIKETIDGLAKSKDFPGDNIVELLVQEALQAKPKSREVSDSGIITDEKKSQEEIEVIEDTSNEIKETVSRKPLKKHCTIISKSSTDDGSNTEAINETPAFMNPRKNVQCRNKPKTIVEADRQKGVEKLFSHVASMKREIDISPFSARKIKETNSEKSLNFDEFMNEDVNTDVEQPNFNNIEIIDCLNDMIDKVCGDFHKLHDKICKKNVIPGTIETVQDQESDIFKDKKVKTQKPKPSGVQKQKKNIKLKYKPAKKAKALDRNKTKNDEKERTKKMSTIIEQEEINMKIDIENVDIVKIQDPEKKTENPGEKKSETPLVRRKRKLYSPKDNDFEEKTQKYTANEISDDVPLSEIKNCNGNKTPKTTATCKDIERERNKTTPLPRFRKCKNRAIEMSAPRTFKMDTMFDNLIQTVENHENVTLVDKNTDIYNFTSGSEDDDFLKKKFEIKKRISSITTGSFKSTEKKQTRNTRGVKVSESSYEEAKKPKTVKRKKLTKRASKRMPNSKVPIVHSVNLVDEIMREPVREELNTSVLIETSKNLEPDEIEPVLQELFKMQEIHDIVPNDTLTSNKIAKKPLLGQTHDSESNDTLVSKRKTKKAQMSRIHDSESNDTLAPKKKVDKITKKPKLLSIKKEKGLSMKDKTITVSDKEDDRTTSPLPGLVVESMPKPREDINNSFTINTVIEKFKKIYQEDTLNDSVNTQNMLTDAERLNCSAQNWKNTADEICYVRNTGKKDAKAEKEKEKKDVLPKTNKSSARKKSKQQVDKDIEILDTVDIHEVNDNKLEKSIATNSITAHADFDEAPPAPETIIEHFPPRELQDLDLSMKNYFTELTRAIHNSTSKDRESSKSGQAEVCTIFRNEMENTISYIPPIVSVKRMSFEDISKWIPSRRTSDTDDSQPSSQKIKSQSKQIHEASRDIRSQTKINVISAGNTPKSVAQNKSFEHSITSSPESIKLKSPIVTIKRMSYEEFSRWLPMPKSFKYDKNVTSIKREGSSSLKQPTRNLNKGKTLTKFKENTKMKTKPGNEIKKPKSVETGINDGDHIDSNDTASHNTKSRSIHMRENGISHKLYSDSVETRSKSKSNAITAIKEGKSLKDAMALKPATLKKRRITKEYETDSDEPYTTKETSNLKEAKKPKTRYINSVDSDKEPTTTNKKKIVKVKRMISPIVLLDHYAPNIEKDNSDDSECVKRKESMFTKSKAAKFYPLKSIISVESTNVESPVHLQKRKSTSTIKSTLSNKRKFDQSKRTDEPTGRIHESKRTVEQKRSIDKPKWKVNVLESISVAQSGPSTSSVNDWCRRAELTSQREDVASLQYGDALHYIIEKLDTTLAESNESTSMKFVNLFMEIQKELSNYLEEIENQIKEDRAVVSAEFLKLVRLMDERNSDFNKKLSLINGFMDKMKQKTLDFIRNDSTHKKAVLQLLKEEVQSMNNHLTK